MRRVVLGGGLAAIAALVALAAAQLAAGSGARRSLSSVHGLLTGVSCSSAMACTAVGGTSSPYDRGHTLAARWDGHGWSIQRTPNPSSTPDSSFTAVSCPSARACMAVGETDNGHVGRYVPLTERWNGHHWAIEPIPHHNNWYLNGVSCSSATNCIAVGIGHDSALAERWNGKRWSVQWPANPAHHQSWLYGVSCASGKTCTAVGFSDSTTLAERWNGQRWSIQKTPNLPQAQGSALQAVSCSDPKSCTAVGYEDKNRRPPSVSLTLAERWNGHQWLIQHTPASARSQGTVLHGVSCATARTCTAAGETEAGFDASASLAERWNGHRWSAQQATQRARRPNLLLAVSCLSARLCVAVGGAGDPRIDQEKPLIEQHF